jgi:hypothetical protein
MPARAVITLGALRYLPNGTTYKLGRGERCVSVRLPNCAITSNKALEDKNTDGRAAQLSGCSERGTSVGANPLHHGTEAVRALRSEMFAQTHAFEQFDGIGVQDLPRALARIDSE